MGDEFPDFVGESENEMLPSGFILAKRAIRLPVALRGKDGADWRDGVGANRS